MGSQPKSIIIGERKMKECILLSYKLTKNTPLYGNTPSIEIKHDKNIVKGDTCNTFLMKLHNHSGTHIDASRHFCNDGKSIAGYKTTQLIFNSPLVVECSKKPKDMIDIKDLSGFEEELRKCDMLILKTGFWKYRNKDIYRSQNPGITPKLADYIRSEFGNIRCIGIDSISISSYSNREMGRKAHEIFLKRNDYHDDPVLLLEDMNLSDKKY